MTLSPTIKFENGVQMPLVGLGTWQSTDDVMREMLYKAIVDFGYRLIDTAPFYANEHVIGEVVNKLIKEGKIKRQDIFITTKIFSTHLNPIRQEQSLRASLEKLQLDYVDLVLAHMPAAMTEDFKEHENIPVEDVWRGFEKLYEKKLARAIGISNFSIEQIGRILKINKVPIHNHQFETYLYLPEHDLVAFCQKHGISTTSYGTLGSPGRFDYKNNEIGFKPAPNPLEDPVVLELAKKHGKSAGQILLHFCLDRGVAIIPKSTNPGRMAQNLDVFDFKLSAEELEKLGSRPHRQRIFTQDFLIGNPEDPFKSER